MKFFMVLITSLVGIFSSWGIGRFVFSGVRQKADRTIPTELFKSTAHGEPYFVPRADVWIVKGDTLANSIALDDRCTHLGCRFKWNGSKGIFECPCHGSEFDIHGNVLKGPASKPLIRLYLTQTSDESLRISEAPAKQ
ncbi:MAG: ubiquinol-cytochrome c reductase iron-sulfur subunit [Desulfomonilaceae bacterium]